MLSFAAIRITTPEIFPLPTMGWKSDSGFFLLNIRLNMGSKHGENGN
jgi:hypothetical protein